MALQGSDLLPVGHIPQSDRLIPTATGQGLPIWRIRHRRDRMRMALQGSDLLPVGHIPQPDRLVQIATG